MESSADGMRKNPSQHSSGDVARGGGGDQKKSSGHDAEPAWIGKLQEILCGKIEGGSALGASSATRLAENMESAVGANTVGDGFEGRVRFFLGRDGGIV